jgi:hypothetical protein
VIAGELKRKGVTQTLLRQEYRAAHPDGCQWALKFPRLWAFNFPYVGGFGSCR